MGLLVKELDCGGRMVLLIGKLDCGRWVVLLVVKLDWVGSTGSGRA